MDRSGSSSGPHEKMEGMSLNSDIIIRERGEVTSEHKSRDENSLYRQDSEESEGIMIMDNHLN